MRVKGGGILPRGTLAQSMNKGRLIAEIDSTSVEPDKTQNYVYNSDRTILYYTTTT